MIWTHSSSHCYSEKQPGVFYSYLSIIALLGGKMIWTDKNTKYRSANFCDPKQHRWRMFEHFTLARGEEGSVVFWLMVKFTVWLRTWITEGVLRNSHKVMNWSKVISSHCTVGKERPICIHRQYIGMSVWVGTTCEAFEEHIVKRTVSSIQSTGFSGCKWT